MVALGVDLMDVFNNPIFEFLHKTAERFSIKDNKMELVTSNSSFNRGWSLELDEPKQNWHK